MTTGADRVRSRLLELAEQDVAGLWPRVAARRAEFLQALEGVTDEQARWRPGTGEGEAAWSIIEVARHLLAWTWNTTDIIEATAAGGTEEKLPGGHLDPDPGDSIDTVRREFVRASMHLLTGLERLPAEPDVATTVEHRAFGPMNHRMWFAMASIHDRDHTQQVEGLKQMEGFPR